MALEMKGACERCQSQLNPQGDAYICSFECTFCTACARTLDNICPNCGGELVMRPRKKARQMVDDANGNSMESTSVLTECQVGS